MLMGAGIPRAIPGALDRLARGEPVRTENRCRRRSARRGIRIHLRSGRRSAAEPRRRSSGQSSLAVISSATLAMTLARKSSGQVNGFIVEGETAGGHNAPPRGTHADRVPRANRSMGRATCLDLEKIRELGLPFWLAGSYGRPGKLAEALHLGAAGIQVGTAFAFCEESGHLPGTKQQAIELSPRRPGGGLHRSAWLRPPAFLSRSCGRAGHACRIRKYFRPANAFAIVGALRHALPQGGRHRRLSLPQRAG